MCVVTEGSEELFRVGVYVAVPQNLSFKVFELLASGQGSIDKEVCAFKMRRLLGKLLNGITSRVFIA